ncbi:MAG: hypothetical protein ACLT8E_01420 [Akkermansia sp.]
MLQEQPRQDSSGGGFSSCSLRDDDQLPGPPDSLHPETILDQELGWTDAQYGMIMSIFQASYAA